MKKALYTLLTINILTLIIGFIALLFSKLIFAIIFLPLGLLELVPLLAIINNLESVENLNYEIYELKSRLKKIEEINNETTAETNTSTPDIERKEVARGTWECVKCGTINKEGTDTCQNCKALYSPWINPTSSPYEKKKISRWIKDKKK